MSRALKFSLFIGIMAALAVEIAHQLGWFDAADFWMSTQLEVGLDDPALPMEAMRLLWLALGIGTAYLVADLTRWSLRLLLTGVLLLELVFATWLLAYFDRYFSPFGAVAAVLLAFGGGAIFALSRVGQRKRQALELLAPRLRLPAIHAVVESPLPLPFSPECREATLLVVEVVNHEQLVDQVPLDQSVQLLNRLLDTASVILLEAGAYLDQSDGEGLRALFGAPLPDSDHAATACQTALDLVRHLDRLNLELGASHALTPDFRIAVHSDEVILASYGVDRQLGAGGEPGDFARALCQANCRYGTRLLIGGRTLELAAKIAVVRPADLWTARESGLPVEIYELIGTKNA